MVAKCQATAKGSDSTIHNGQGEIRSTILIEAGLTVPVVDTIDPLTGRKRRMQVLANEPKLSPQDDAIAQHISVPMSFTKRDMSPQARRAEKLQFMKEKLAHLPPRWQREYLKLLTSYEDIFRMK